MGDFSTRSKELQLRGESESCGPHSGLADCQARPSAILAKAIDLAASSEGKSRGDAQTPNCFSSLPVRGDLGQTNAAVGLLRGRAQTLKENAPWAPRIYYGYAGRCLRATIEMMRATGSQGGVRGR